MISETCMLCAVHKDDEKLLSHHISYGKEITMTLCHPCHQIIHTFIMQKRKVEGIKDRRVTCYNDKCKHQWNYKGVRDRYITCPNCKYSLNIKRLNDISDARINKKVKNFAGL